MANDHRKGKGKGRRDPSPRDRRRDNRSNDRNDERPSRGARSGDRSNDRRGPVSPRPQGAPQQQADVQCDPRDPRPSISGSQSPRPSRASRKAQAIRSSGVTTPTPPNVKENPSQKAMARPRSLPAFSKLDLEDLRHELEVEIRLDALPTFFDAELALAHGLLFFHVEYDTVVFAAPSGRVQEVKGRNILHVVVKLLRDPHVVKVGTYHHKRLIEAWYGVQIIGHLDPIPLRSSKQLRFRTEIECLRDHPDPKDYILKKATRRVRQLIFTYWELVISDPFAKEFPSCRDLSPWSRLTLAKYSDAKGRPESFKEPLSDQEVAAKLDADPYYSEELPYLHYLPFLTTSNRKLAEYDASLQERDEAELQELQAAKQRELQTALEAHSRVKMAAAEAARLTVQPPPKPMQAEGFRKLFQLMIAAVANLKMAEQMDKEDDTDNTLNISQTADQENDGDTQDDTDADVDTQKEKKVP